MSDDVFLDSWPCVGCGATIEHMGKRGRPRQFCVVCRPPGVGRTRTVVEKPPRFCSECGELLQGAHRVTCGARRCRDRRFQATNPEGYAAREAGKVVRAREKRRIGREAVRFMQELGVSFAESERGHAPISGLKNERWSA